MTPSANALTAAILLEIPKRFPGSRAWRNNVLIARTRDERVVRAGVPGQGDVSGILAPSGRRCEIEIKVGKDRQSEKQKNFQAMITAAGGIYIIARDVEQAMRELEEELRR